MLKVLLLTSLNPCCNGRWSRTARQIADATNQTTVLILVVMEDGLVPFVRNYISALNGDVLILVVMEDGLVLAGSHLATVLD